jgi:glucan biosynthesis protein C
MYYFEPALDDSLPSLLMLLFMMFNLAWSIGALFFLAGYFTPGSYDRKGVSSFLQGRLIRLGVPLLVYVFVLHPLLLYWVDKMTGAEPQNLFYYLGEVGPLWFVFMLLIFCFGYAAWRKLTENWASSPPNASSPPGYVPMGIFVLVLALVTYLYRIIAPAAVIPGLTSLLPQYISFFALGTVADRRDWLRTIPDSRGVVGLVIALAASLVLFPIAFFAASFNFKGTGPGSLLSMRSGSLPLPLACFWAR